VDDKARQAVSEEAGAALLAVERILQHLEDPLEIWRALLDVRHQLSVIEELLLDAGHAPSA
jgi:hypothetical protein